MPGPIFLEGERLTLRAVRPEDYAFVVRHVTNPWIRHGGFEKSHSPPTEEDLAARVEEDDDFHIFLACRDDTPVGSVFLDDVDLELRNAELGYFIKPDEQGNGYATEAADLCLTHAFDELGLHKVWAKTVEDNGASKRVLEKLGFQQEGIRREHVWGFGRYVDEHLFGLLESER